MGCINQGRTPCYYVLSNTYERMRDYCKCNVRTPYRFLAYRVSEINLPEVTGWRVEYSLAILESEHLFTQD